MSYILGVNLLPSTGEFTYDTIPYLGQRVTEVDADLDQSLCQRRAAAGTGTITDYTIAIEQSAGANSRAAQQSRSSCPGSAIRPTSPPARSIRRPPTSTAASSKPRGASDVWRCSGLTQSSTGLIPIPQSGGAFIYGGTPSDQSIVRCISDLKSRGLRVVFYPFILMTASGEPWRGRIAYDGSGYFQRRDGGGRTIFSAARATRNSRATRQI